MKIFHNDKKIDKYILEYFDTIRDEDCYFSLETKNLTDKHCGTVLKSMEKLDFAQSDIGFPVFSDSLLEGVVLVVENDDNPTIYEEVTKHRKYLEKYLNNTAETEKPRKEEKTKEEKKTQGEKSKKEEKKPQKEEKMDDQNTKEKGKTKKENTHEKNQE